MEKFQNREEAGKLLAEALQAYANRQDVVVLALPRGGVPVAFEAAEQLHLPLDVFIVRKLGVPGQEELAMGAIAMGGMQVLNEEVMRNLNISAAALARVSASEQEELRRREQIYRGKLSPLQLKNKTIILIDDGIATGATMRAAIQSLRQFQPAVIIVAVPVAATAALVKIALMADNVVCLLQPPNFNAVGAHYVEFEQTSDAEVYELLMLNQKAKKYK